MTIKKKKTVLIVRKTKGGEDTEHRKRDPLASLKCFYLSQKKHDMVFWLTLTLRAMLSIHYRSQVRVRPVFPPVDHKVVFWTVFI